MGKILKVSSWFIVPIAVPGWVIESAYRRIRKRFWEFNIWSGTIYIFSIIFLSFLFLFSPYLVLRAVGVYIFSALELLGILTCASLVFGNIGDYTSTIVRLSKRKRNYKFSEKDGLRISHMWIAMTSFFYTVVYFSAISFFLNSLDSSAYLGTHGQNSFETFFDFFFFSFVSLVTLGNSEISPVSFLAKIIFMIEIVLGLLFSLFIFSIIVENIMSQRKG